MARAQVLTRLARIRTNRANIDAARQVIEEDEAKAVLEARQLGLTWEEIAQALGRTRSAVWEKHHHHADHPQ